MGNSLDWQITYIAEAWSLPYSNEIPEGTKPGDKLSCGVWSSLDSFVEGVLPGTYRCDNGNNLVTLVIGT